MDKTNRKRKTPNMFSLESLEECFSAKKSIIQELNTHVSFLRNFDLASSNQFGEEEALMILASKFTFRGVYLLKAVIKHVPKTYSMKLSEFGGVSLRTQLIYEITSASDTPVASLNHNRLTRARLFSLGGPVPASKITLECRNCKISYGIARYAHDGKSHYYPKTFTGGIIEVSNTTYMSERLYKWIPSLR